VFEVVAEADPNAEDDAVAEPDFDADALEDAVFDKLTDGDSDPVGDLEIVAVLLLDCEIVGVCVGLTDVDGVGGTQLRPFDASSSGLLHRHEYDPTVFTHTWSHPCEADEHSS